LGFLLRQSREQQPHRFAHASRTTSARNRGFMWVAYAIRSALFKQNLQAGPCRPFVFGLLLDCLNWPACWCVSITLPATRGSLHSTGGSSVSTDKRRMCKTQPMNKYIFCLIGAIVGMAFIASCQQQGTTTAPAAAKPTPTPSRTHHKTTGGMMQRSKPAPSSSPAESPAPTP
jgi:hypothetical protein